jgi:pimeloyl-ACP methyl ester carboxylesterase
LTGIAFVKQNLLYLIGVILMFFFLTSAVSESSEPVSEEVTWSIGDTKVYATITRPQSRKSGEPLPAVVFVAGSGPTDRDWNSPLIPGTNGSAKLLAHELAQEGFVTLRYDKRASGPHAKENLSLLIGKVSMQSHLEELAGAVELIASLTYVDPAKIFVLTNSEGAVHALNYQTKAEMIKFAGLILTGAPGRTIEEVAQTQIQVILDDLPNSEDLMADYNEAIKDFLAEKPVKIDPSLPQAVQMVLQSLITPVNLPFSRELWTADIKVWLREVEVPVLIITGKKDIQADWQLDGGALEQATPGRSNITFTYPENADHVLKYEERPRKKLSASDSLMYNSEDRVLDPDVLAAIKSWLTKRMKK